jgi:cellulase (glycosyl hydrolase family 5)
MQTSLPRRWLLPIIGFVLATLGQSCGRADEAGPSIRPLGLVVEGGILNKDGMPYRGIGVNYFNAFLRTLTKPGDDTYRQGFQTLRQQYDIPFIRFNAGGFWPSNWKLYLEDKQRYFALMDAFVQEAEDQGLGLIPSLFWYYACVPDLVGEPMDQWGNPQSKTHAFMRAYVGEVVGRYKDSPAVWAWEFGNEYLLTVDLPGPEQGLPKIVPQFGTPPERSPRDKMQRLWVETAYQEFAKAVRALDPHRLLITGDALPRACAHHLQTERAWKKDTRRQWTRMLLRSSPDRFGCVSIHVYPQRDGEYFPEQVGLRTLLGVCHDAAATAGKPLFVGEFGACRELGQEQARARLDELLDALLQLKIPLAALWVYDLPHQDKTCNVTADNDRAYMLDALRAANTAIQP